MKQRSLIVPLDSVGRESIPVAGGKAANLGEMLRAGLPVPAGFVITTAAYDLFVAENGISTASPEHPAAIRDSFLAGKVPGEIASVVEAAYGEIGWGKVAVRSSATAEDLPSAAFAGQHDTFLDVDGTDALVDAVVRCWASLWSERAVAYRRRLHLEAVVKLAVAVQRMITPDFAGVLFTANPVTGERNEMVVDSTPGLGEGVVSGKITPSHYVLRRGWRGWGKRQPPGAGAPPGLHPASLGRLEALGSRIEKLFEAPQDIEWAVSAGRVFIVQSRPITSLPPPPPHPGKVESFFAGVIAEVLSVRPYPLDATSWLPEVFRAIRSFFTPFGLRLTPFEQLFAEEDGIIAGLSGRRPITVTPWVWLTPLRLAWNALRFDPSRLEQDPLLKQAIIDSRSLESRDLAICSWDELFAGLEQAAKVPAAVAGVLRQRYLPRPALAAAALRLLLGVTRHEDRFLPLLTGMPNKTLAANRAMARLAARVRGNPELAAAFAAGGEGLAARLPASAAGQGFLDEFGRFLDTYGHREGALSTMYIPAWKDNPRAVLEMVRGLAAQPAPSDAGVTGGPASGDEVFHSWPWNQAPFSALLRRLTGSAKRLLQVREDTHFYATLAFPAMRRSFIEMGRRMAGAGALERPEDVFHLRLEEIREFAEAANSQATAARLREVGGRRKRKRAALEGSPLIDPRLYSRAAGEDVVVRGTPASPGEASGVARVIRGPEDFGRLQQGDVLVAPYTNPSWTPLFQKAAAVVVDTGGMASHAAIVAREYRIPAVMGAVGATRRLQDGEVFMVDGSRGTVSASPATGEAASFPVSSSPTRRQIRRRT